MEVGETARGIFGGSASGGRAFSGFQRRRKKDSLDRFAELLSFHIDDDDIAAGKLLQTGADLPEGTVPDPGGDPKKVARRMGLKDQSGHAMLHRLKQRLGPQAI